jgi:hypothetical protein
METIPLAEGDLRWVFPELANSAEVLDVLRQADAQMRRLADHLGVRPSWTGSGVEFHRQGGSWASLFGCAEVDGAASFAGELSRVVTDDGLSRSAWEVDGVIAVRCDARIDCGMHTIEERAARRHDSPLGAANDLLVVMTWLLERGVAEPVSSWRRRDRRSGHG